MSQCRIYLLHPPEIPFVEWVQEACSLLENDYSWRDWSFWTMPYDANHYFPVNIVLGWVNSIKGPVVVIERVQRRLYESLRQQLALVVPVLLTAVSDSTDIYAAIEEARRLFEEGQPLLPEKFVLAVLVVRKLIDGHYWTGNAKGYLWSGDLPNGRGIPLELVHKVHEVANDLLNRNIIVKKISCGKTKYALNPERKNEIYKIAQTGDFENKGLLHVLNNSKHQVQARLLDLQDKSYSIEHHANEENQS